MQDMQVDVESALTHAGLPADLFNRADATLTPDEYYRLWRGLEQATGEQEMALLLAEALSVEAFDPPLFAAVCSPDLDVALTRIQQYKPLIGPMHMAIHREPAVTRLSLSCYDDHGPMPTALELAEFTFFTQLARLATRHRVCPVEVCVSQWPEKRAEYEQYFGCRVRTGKAAVLGFSSVDMARPFLTANARMWAFFESELNTRLANLDTDSTVSERLRAVLLELLPAGLCSIDVAADRLAVSKRTLQRKLTAESVSYHDVLQSVREELADHYLTASRLPLAEIAFLLGYNETNSFIRAFSAWKGVAPGNYRETWH